MNKAYEAKFDELFEELVPGMGASETVAGEIVRAVCRIGYRYNNDGDIINCGYGKETCNAAARYIAANTTEEIDEIIDYIFCNFQYASFGDAEYENALDNLMEKVLEYLEEHPELKETKNTEDMFDYYDADEDEDWDDEEDEYDEYDEYYDDEEEDEDEDE